MKWDKIVTNRFSGCLLGTRRLFRYGSLRLGFGGGFLCSRLLRSGGFLSGSRFGGWLGCELLGGCNGLLGSRFLRNRGFGDSRLLDGRLSVCLCLSSGLVLVIENNQKPSIVRQPPKFNYLLGRRIGFSFRSKLNFTTGTWRKMSARIRHATKLSGPLGRTKVPFSAPLVIALDNCVFWAAPISSLYLVSTNLEKMMSQGSYQSQT